MSKTERRGLAKEPQEPSKGVKSERSGQNVGEIEKTNEEDLPKQQESEGPSGFDTLRDITRGLV